LSLIDITFPDSSVKQFEQNVSILDIAKSISNSLAKKALGAIVNEKMVGVDYHLEKNASVKILTFKDEEGKELFWHSSAHLMAQAIKRLYPEAKLGIGPSIADGFYYDIDLDKSLSPEDFDAIEAEMGKIVDENIEIKRKVLRGQEAVDFFKKMGENLKVELISELVEQGEEITAYTQGEFTDLCRGPHLPSTQYAGKNFKLLSVAGAYWRGDEKNKMLQRLYATNYPDKKELKRHLKRIEEAKKRDHRKLGRELDLFSLTEETGAGLILWHPKGALMRHIIETYWKDEHLKSGYQLVSTPHIAKLDLWETSGHTGFYQENMFKPMEVDESEYQLKPMNCPFHMTIYNSSIRSYRDLPMRYAELGTVYRYERSGVLHGLMRVRGFTQDDAHIYCHPDQLTDEIINVLDLNAKMLSHFGFTEYDVYLSTRPDKFVGGEESWDHATKALQKALELKKIDYTIDPGEGVFYGPKIDIKIKDTLGRSWQCSTIQVDFNLPERFNLNFVDKNGERQRPITIHRALLGSLERFFGILIEHYAGNFPLWLAPVQVVVLPLADRHFAFAQKVKAELENQNFRADLDARNEKIGFKIREAEVKKIPYMLIIGDKELEAEKVSLRHKGEGDLGQIELIEVISRIRDELQR
jgi:threonyl-tRNA synthetase